tara:strand:+ start:271 stop:1149 length:879 start_codon:yes stop_codon:yes gene_type:complete
VKPAKFQYHKPQTIYDAIQLLSHLQNARILAGGQTLVPILNFRLSAFDNIVDLGCIPELLAINENVENLDIGSMVTQRMLEKSSLIKEKFPLLSNAIKYVGHRQTRNRGTIGGSLCHLDPSAEIPLVALTLQASVEIVGPQGSREALIDDFMEDMLTPEIAEDEIVTKIKFPLCYMWNGWAFTEFSRRKGDFAIVAIACVMQTGADGAVKDLVLAAGGLCEVPFRLKKIEDAIRGKKLNQSLLASIFENGFSFDALDDVFAPAWYRNRLAFTGSKRVVSEAYARCLSFQELA